ncbi:winged helix-turn-helix domain-containing protein [Mycolicibacterium arseniciresistens]|uniref:Winged helix-turn-helix domain-containing protein n=1 Tax=Mycolicibacterium arseniciresistens TaxID=3062257 RepID=A0ABT8U9Y5_9MYCO|nr:winged helix-turn-helix domain-containing protein [Mycolicibacterium arseniciresistens]MDO3634594.1 winged helix-turn-helix domain-containing protein [Mycolicibacterium arseniciresistens]
MDKCSAALGKQVFGPLSVDVGRREVLLADELIRLTRTQFDILAALAQRGSRVTSRQELLDTVWGPSWAGCADVVDMHIGHCEGSWETILPGPCLC